MKKESEFDSFLETYSGERLLKEHSLDERGVWRIMGEDPNCDYGGGHSNPYLETVSGTLREAIEHGVKLPGFWKWGYGGNFIKTEIKNLSEE